MITYGARWVFPVDGNPLPNGSVTVRGDRIRYLHGATELSGVAPDVDLGNVAILPGFVNAHTHLDLCGAHGRCSPSSDFTAWLREVIAFRRERTPEQVRQDIAAGIAACLLSGTTLVGDISSGGASWDQLSRAPMRATVYYELIGLTHERAEESYRQAAHWIRDHPATETCQPGLSPHAPYSVRRELFEAVARLKDVAVAIHLAETTEEIELLQHRSGPFVEFLRELGVWDPTGLVSGPNDVLAMFHDSARTIIIHGNHLDPAEYNPDMKQVVICPRTSYRFGRGLGALDKLGTIYALGTDSLASNPDLDMLAEARFVYRQQRVPSDAPDRRWWLKSLLSDITKNGARGLGWENQAGTLRPGKSADLVILPLPNRDAADPHDLIFDSDLPVRSVMFRGQWVVGEPPA